MGVLPITAPPERGTFFRLQLYERVGILLVVVYERVGKSVISVCEMPKRPNRWILWIIKSGKRYIFVIDSYWNDNAFTAVQKEMQSSYQGMWKGFHLSKKNYTKGLRFSRKMVYKRVRVGFHLGAEPPRVNICWVLRARKGKNFEKNNCTNA